jgi:two-component system, NarL family, nitrate/nitrite response regulator NarL
MRCASLVIADRHPVVLQGLAKVLGGRLDFKIVAACSDGRSCIEAIRGLVPDIALLELSMPGLTGLEILAISNSENLSTRLVCFTASPEERELVMSAVAGLVSAVCHTKPCRFASSVSVLRSAEIPRFIRLT